MKICIKSLITCDAVYVLEDWHESPGATLEMQIARALDIKLLNVAKSTK